MSLPNAMPETYFNEEHYPKTIAWRNRYRAAIENAKKEAPTPKELSGGDTIAKILDQDMFESKLEVVEDPSGFKAGDELVVHPSDTGFTRPDRGKLIGLTKQEVVLQKVSQQGGKEIHVHFPRWNFTIEKAAALNGEK